MRLSILAFVGMAAAATLQARDTSVTDTIGALGDGTYINIEEDGKTLYKLVAAPVDSAPVQTRSGRLVAMEGYACPGEKLNHDELKGAATRLANQFGNGYQLRGNIAQLHGSVAVFVCNYNGNAGSQWNSGKLFGKRGQLDGHCGGADTRGHINEDKGEGNFGRTWSSDHWC